MASRHGAEYETSGPEEIRWYHSGNVKDRNENAVEIAKLPEYQNGADVLSCGQFPLCDLHNDHHVDDIHNTCTPALPRTHACSYHQREREGGEDRGGIERKKVRHREEGRRDERDRKVKLTQRDRSRDLHRAINTELRPVG